MDVSATEQPTSESAAAVLRNKIPFGDFIFSSVVLVFKNASTVNAPYTFFIGRYRERIKWEKKIV